MFEFGYAGLGGVFSVQRSIWSNLVLHGLFGIEQVLQQFALVEFEAGLDLIAASVELPVVAIAPFEHVVDHRLLHRGSFIIILSLQPHGQPLQFLEQPN